MLAAAFVAAQLVACGGGSGSAALPSPPPPAPPPPPDVSPVAPADPGSTLPEGWQHGAFMEVFVRSYQDSDGDGIGDLKGLTSRLDYLQDLGVRGLWLMPVTASQDHDHGYAVVDYRGIEAAYGSLADLDELLAQAHARGIGVVLDYVMNHSASQNPAFLASGASTSNAFRDWYVWQDHDPGGWNLDPWRAAATGVYFAQFSSTMPDWNLRNADVVAYHHDNLRFWLNRGVDGFRFDAVGNFVENGPLAFSVQPEDDALAAGDRAVLDGYQRRWMVCEVPDAPQRFGAPDVCGSAFAFDLNGAILRAVQGDAAAVAAVAHYFDNAPAGMSTLLSNHDSFAGLRPWDQLGGDEAALRLAAASYLLLPGTPFLYYGEEVGMGGAPLPGDFGLRAPMSWTADARNAGFSSGTPYRSLAGNSTTRNVAAQVDDPSSLRSFYRDLLRLRHTRPSLSQGDYAGAFAQGTVMGFQRRLGAQGTLVLLNDGTGAGTAAVAGLPAGATLTRLYPADGATLRAAGDGTLSAPLAARSVQVWDVAGP